MVAEPIEVAQVIERDGEVVLTGLPFRKGERVRVRVIPDDSEPVVGHNGRYPLRGMVYRYDDPTEPATSSDDWEANR
jgi:predicted RNA-binding protein YlqC (UPF0109 family)